MSNQDGIYDAVLKNEKDRNGMLCMMETVHGVHYLKILDNHVVGQAQAPSLIKVSMEELHTFFVEKKDMRLYNYFQSLVDMMASICMERNYKCIN